MCPSVHCEIAVREIERRETTNVCGGQQQEMESGDPELESESGDRRGAKVRGMGRRRHPAVKLNYSFS